MWCWDLNSGPFRKQPMVLASESSLQPLTRVFFSGSSRFFSEQPFQKQLGSGPDPQRDKWVLPPSTQALDLSLRQA